MAGPILPVPPSGVTVGAFVAGAVSQLNTSVSAIHAKLACTAGNILVAVISTLDANGNLAAIAPSQVHPTATDGSVFTAIASVPNNAEFGATCATTGTVTFNVLLSSSTLNVVLQVWEYLP